MDVWNLQQKPKKAEVEISKYSCLFKGSLVGWVFCVCLETGSHSIVQVAWNSLCRPEWPRTSRDPPASAAYALARLTWRWAPGSLGAVIGCFVIF